jgi:catecholate siderophore receptor
VTARRRAAAIGAGALAMTPTLALAEGAQPVDGVTVTARLNGYGDADNRLSKLPQDLSDIPQSVVVINKALMQSQGVTSLSDALRNVPGITIGGAEGGQIGNNINLNGFSARTDIYLDGMRDRGQYYRDTFALDAVEVLMGPSSMLFGRGSTGGVINQISKRPVLHPIQEVDGSVTTNGLVRGVADVNMPFSDNAAARIAVMGQTGAATTGDRSRVEDYGVAPSVRYGIGTPTEVTVSMLVQHNHDQPDYGIPPLNGHPAPVDRDSVYGYSTDRTISKILALGGEVRHDLASGIKLRDQIQYNNVQTDVIETAGQGTGTVGARGYTAFSPAGVSSLPLNQIWVRLQSHDRDISDTTLFNQLEASGEFSTGPLKHAFIVGNEIGHETYDNQNYYRTGSCNGVGLATGYTGCVTLLNPFYTGSPTSVETPGNLATGTADDLAFYFSDTMSVTPQVKLVGGVRWDRYDAKIGNSINASNTTGNTTLANASQNVTFISARAGAIWQPTHAQSYYASYSSSFNPSLEQLTSTTGLSLPLPPEENYSYEVGAKWQLFHEGLNLDAALFQITKDNARSQNPDGTYTADGDIRVRGVRLGAAGRLTRSWQVFGGYTHLNAKIIDAIAPGTQGMVPASTPSNAATFWTTYDLPAHWQIGGGATYVGKRYANNTDLVSVPGYVRLDATVAYRVSCYEVRLNLFNLTNKYYYDTLIQSDGGRAAPGSGTTAMLSFVVRR